MARPKRSALALVLALAAVTGPGALASGPSPRRVGSTPRLPRGARVAGSLAGSQPIHVTVALQPRDPAALEAFAIAVSTPGSSMYRHYITPSQFAAQFGPSSAQIAAVESSLRAHGLQPGPPSANHLSLPVTSSAGRIERAFSIGLERIALQSHATAIVNTAAPLLDANVAGLVQGVVGLSSLATPHPLYVRPHLGHAHATPHVVTGGPQPCSAARAAAPSQRAYTADQIASAYGFSGLYGAGDQGKGQTIALYELEPYDPSDVAAYQSCYGVHQSVSNVSVDGGAGSGPGVGEAALDVEQTLGLAPQATVLVYEGPNSSSSAPGSGYYDTWSTLIGQDRARVVSASWGQCEASVPASDARAENTLFEEAAAQGQTIFSSAGDAGSEDCNGQTLLPDFRLSVDDPSSQPFVTGVGGTALSELGPRPVEEVWNDGGGLSGLLGLGTGAGGGGKSTLWGMPSYQSGAPSFLHVAQSSSRETPDVSADANPNTGYLIYWNGTRRVAGQPVGWQGIGGTSAAAPVWASAVALINSSKACNGALVGFANPALYKAAATAYSQDFNDVTRGNNDFTGTNGGRYAAGAGFDLASGLGTPNASALIGTLCQGAAHPGAPKISGSSLSGVGNARPKLRVTLKAGRAAPGLEKISIRLPNGLHFARKPGRVTVTGLGGSRLGFTASVHHGVLTVRLRHAATLATVSVRYATLTATSNEAATVRGGNAGRQRITVTVTDAHGIRTTLHASIRPH